MIEQEMVLSQGSERKKYVRGMFNAIAHRYDFLNHVLSLGIDIYWRRKAISKLDVPQNGRVLDLACGTGDFAIETQKRKKCRVTGVDIAFRMLHFGREKLKKNKLSQIDYLNGDGEQLPLKGNSFDGLTIAFGIRNMGTIPKALSEMHRVLSPNGQAIVLEFSLPTFKPFRILYLFYFNHILPGIGRIISRDAQAYSYLPASVEKFPEIPEFIGQMKSAGFSRLQHWKLLNGVAVIYKGIK